MTALSKGAGFAKISEYFRFMLLNPSIDKKLNRILGIIKDLQEKANNTVVEENSGSKN